MKVIALFLLLLFSPALAANAVCTTAESASSAHSSAEVNDVPKGAKVLYTYVNKDKATRTFYAMEQDERINLFCCEPTDPSPRRIATPYDRYDDGYDFYENGLELGYDGYLDYFVSPNGRYLYVVADIHANSNGWVTEFQLFKIDCKTLSVRLLTEAAAITATSQGFVYAACRLTNESIAQCTADEIWVMHDVVIDWDGRLLKDDKHREYAYNAMERKYGKRLRKGFKKIHF